ncbi:MAG: ABC-F family ATP-binding cassette domain-containing protein [Bacteroidaceae bacterium]|nr:ABC-F family ATP-binding cassette domain-containing protein [Bacteroidaceae bacterium]
MVSYLQVQSLTRRVGDRCLFADLSFGIGQGQKVGLIAKNGTGKSTLLNILAGTDSADEGQVVYRNGLRVGYLEQTPHYPEDLTVIEACFWHGNEVTNLIREYETCMSTPGNPNLQEILDRMDHQKAWDYETRSKAILSRLAIDEFDKPLRQLSGGQLKRVALANVLITEPDFLILDEPTNHLDLTMIEWLENHLRRSNVTLLMVTHDRYFLDRVCNEILELDDETIYSYRGNYAYYLEKRQERLDAARSEVARANNLYRTELEWMRRMPQARGHKARYREEAFYELQQVAKRRLEEKQVRLETRSAYIGSKIFEAQYVSKSFPLRTRNGQPAGEPEQRKVILRDFYYNFSRFEKMGIVGDNGTGKSTFVKMLMGEVQPDSGRFVVGETVKFGYFSQEGMKFDEQMKVIDAVRKYAEFIDLGGGRHLSAMQFLQHFMFTPLQQQSYIYKLSGGEKRRLHLCTVLMQAPNFLVLDEPTNDLDIVTLQILEQYLQDFQGCVIVVSHDRYFMDRVVDHLLVFRGDGVVKDFPGNYTQFREWEALEERDAAQKKSAAPATPTHTAERHTSERPRKMSFKEKQEYAVLESDIERLEQEKHDIETALSSGQLSVDDITQKSIRLPQLQQELDEKSMRWLELSELA